MIIYYMEIEEDENGDLVPRIAVEAIEGTLNEQAVAEEIMASIRDNLAKKMTPEEVGSDD